MKKIFYLAGCFILFLANASTVFADAFRNLNQGAAATGQGGAFAAQADDPSALHYNPANIANLEGVQLSAGASFYGGYFSFSSPAGEKATGDFNGPAALPPPSNFYLTANLGDIAGGHLKNVSVGLGVNSPYGLLLGYPGNGPFSTVLTGVKMLFVDIKPTVAFKVHQDFSVGFGLDIYTFPGFIRPGHVEVRQKAGPAFAPLGISEGTSLEASGKDTAVGYNISFLSTLLRNSNNDPLLNLAFVYRSPAVLRLEGALSTNGSHYADLRANLNLPRIYSGGAGFWPVRNGRNEWKVEFDLEYADWSTAKNADAHLSNGVTLPSPQDWRGAFVYMFGSEYKWLQNPAFFDMETTLRAGYQRGETPIPDVNFNPMVPDANYNSLSAGLGLGCKKRGSFLGLFDCGGESGQKLNIKSARLDLAYEGIFYESRNIRQNVNPEVTGLWRSFVHVGAINLSLGF